MSPLLPSQAELTSTGGLGENPETPREWIQRSQAAGRLQPWPGSDQELHNPPTLHGWMTSGGGRWPDKLPDSGSAHELPAPASPAPPKESELDKQLWACRSFPTRCHDLLRLVFSRPHSFLRAVSHSREKFLCFSVQKQQLAQAATSPSWPPSQRQEHWLGWSGEICPCPWPKLLQPGTEADKFISLVTAGCAEPRLQNRKENAIMEQHFEAHLKEMFPTSTPSAGTTLI